MSMSKKITRNIPEISNVSTKKNTITFTISNTNVSFVNALRRTILTHIPLCVFKTSPYEENLCNIETNTSRLNNEILKQRLSCIPIHIKDLENVENLQVEVDVENTTESVIYITTGDFKIKDTLTDKYLSSDEVQKIFPPNEFTKEYILFARLRPKIANSIPGEKISFNCKLTTSTAEVNGAFNVASTCTYFNAEDIGKQNEEWAKYSKNLKGKSKLGISKEKKNWFNHKAKKYYLKDTFNFNLETIGIYTNIEIIKKACSILVDKLQTLETLFLNQENLIEKSTAAIENCYTIKLLNEDYTIGKMIEYILHNDYYKKGSELAYVGFIKKHPHDKDSFIKLAFNSEENANIESVKTILNYSILQCKSIVNHINESFG